MIRWEANGMFFDFIADLIDDHFIATIVVIVVLFGSGVWWYESAHPCLKYSPTKTLQYMQQVGNVIIPVYGHDCLERK